VTMALVQFQWSERLSQGLIARGGKNTKRVEMPAACCPTSQDESARARAQRWAPHERPGPHAKPWPERWRHVTKKVAASGAAPVGSDGTGGVHAQPVAAGLAERIDALHGQAGQVLHSFTSETAKPGQSCGSTFEQPRTNRMGRAALLLAALP
jgi:hypothetical protein